MQSTLEPLEGNKVKLIVAVESAEVDEAVDAAARKLARGARMPGFRPGKIPRRVLEARMGHGALRQEALRESLPDFYASAVRDLEVDVIAPPDIDITAGQEDGDLHFDAVVEVRPSVTIPGYGGLVVTLDRPEATEEELDAQIDRLRTTGAALEDSSLPARDGDVVTVDLGMIPTDAGVQGEPSELTDVSYTVGSAEFGIADLDVNLRGARTGDIIKFTTDVTPERSMALQVLVKAVREKVLPDLTDEWVDAETEFSSVEELRTDTRDRIIARKRSLAAGQLRERALEALAELVTDDPPKPLIDAELERRLGDLGRRLEAQGVTVERYLASIGSDPEAFVEHARGVAVPAVKADLALRAVAVAEALDATEEDIDNEIARLATSLDLPPADVRRNLVTTDQLTAVRSDVRKTKALAWLIEHVDVVDSEGRPIDRAELEPMPAPRSETGSAPRPDEGSSTSGDDPTPEESPS